MLPGVYLSVLHHCKALLRVYSQGCGGDDAVKMVFGGQAQWRGMRITFAAGLRWPAWSSAGPEKYSVYACLQVGFKINTYVNIKFVYKLKLV